MTWMQRLKRVFNIDIETYERSAGQVKIIVEASNRCIEDPAVIERILAHLKGKEPSSELAMLPEGRAPPQARLGAPGFSTDSMDTLSSALLLPFRKQRAYYWLEGRKQGKAGRGAKNQRLNGLDFVGKGASDGGPVDVGCDEGVFNSSYTRIVAESPRRESKAAAGGHHSGIAASHDAGKGGGSAYCFSEICDRIWKNRNAAGD